MLDVGTLEDGAPFMVMEYLDGQDLDHILRHRGPLSIPDAVGYMMQACEAIAEAHHIGIVHRDLKPSNFFLTTRTDGSPLIKVLDFGIAKARAELEQEVSLTKTRTVLGSPVYMSPEQIRSARSVDHRSDIWSLGVTLYELLTDQLPFDGDSITGVAAAVSTDPIAPIRSIRPEIPIGLSLVIERCLEKKPNDRYQTIADFAEDLVPYGPESARYSLTRIRGALGMKTSESGKHKQPSVTDADSILATTSTLMLTDSFAEIEPEQRTKRRQVIIYAAVLLALVAIGTVVFSRRGTAASQVAGSAASVPPNVSSMLPTVAAPPDLAKVVDAPSPVSLSNPQMAPEPNTAHSAELTSSNVPRKPSLAGTSVTRSAEAKTTTSNRPAAKGTSTNRRGEDIFDTRK